MARPDSNFHTARQSVRVWALGLYGGSRLACVLQQYRRHVHCLKLERQPMHIISIVGGLTSAGCAFLLADSFGYLFPFTINAVTLPWFTVVIVLMLLVPRRELTVEARHQTVCVCEILLTIMYPLFNAAFVDMNEWEQTASVVMFPIIKIVANTWISRWLLNTDDARPEYVVFNVERFHALRVVLDAKQHSLPNRVPGWAVGH